MIKKIAVGVSFPIETVEKIDQIRGGINRSTIIRELVDRGFETKVGGGGVASFRAPQPLPPGDNLGGNE